MAQSNLEVIISAQDRASRTIGNVARSLGSLDGASRRVGKGFAQMGAGLVATSAAVVGAVGTAGAFVAREAIKFEDAFAGVRKTVDEVELAAAGLTFEDLARQFRDFATEIPIAATEFARLGETAGALGVKVQDIDEFVKTTALLGVTTDLTADAAADSLGRIGTILNFTGQDYQRFADVLVALGNDGASVESEIIEITKRFATQGTQAGLTTEAIAALASATASLGFAPERGGTALARVFGNMAKNISLANEKGEAFAKVTGRSITDLQKALDKGEGMGIFMDFLEGLRGMSPTQIARALSLSGIGNQSDLALFQSMAANLPFILDQLNTANESAGALSEEAAKRFDTVASKLQLLKNNLIEAAITIGEGFAPAIGRAATKLSEFLKQDDNRAELKRLGEDIGKFIDGIDWAGVISNARTFVSLAKDAATFALKIVDAFTKLPPQVQAAAGALAILSKVPGGNLILSGGANIVGGLAETLLRSAGSRLPGVGAAFAQPVFVTNWPLGGLGGGIGGAAGGLGPMSLLSVASAGAAGAAVLGTVQSFLGDSLRDIFGSQGVPKDVADAVVRGMQLSGIPNIPVILGDIERGFRELTGQNRPPSNTMTPETAALLAGVDPRAPTPGGDRASNNNFYANPIRLRMEERARTGGRDFLTALHQGNTMESFNAADERTSYLLAATIGEALPKTIASDIRAMTQTMKELKAEGKDDEADTLQAYIDALNSRLQELEAAEQEKADAITEATREANNIATVAATSATDVANAIANLEPPVVNVTVPVTTSNIYRNTVIWRTGGNGSRVNVGDRVAVGPGGARPYGPT